ncbi:fluoride efflux transporter CrcB [Sphaerimonospora cavernae]|uniref:Fluoride-specific ion channel FluC n=1 Tax=Sphaerimonospora cavernae TaxID=1740611 RepID=A0ABV6U6E5_9ACTN
MTLLLVFLGGAVGAPARYLIDRFVQRRHDNVFPWGTLTVNIVGSLILGFLLGARSGLGLPQGVVALAGTGFCGALTTFSTFGFETMRLLEEGSAREAGLNAVGSLFLGVLAAAGGHALAGLFA